MEQKFNCSKLVQWSRIALTNTEGFLGGPQSLGFHQRSGCWRDQASWVLLACQSLLGLTHLCCYSAEACKKERTKMRSLPSPKKHSKCRVEKANHEFMTTKPTLSQGWSNSLCLGRECQKDSGLVLLYQTETTREMVRYRGNIDWAGTQKNGRGLAYRPVTRFSGEQVTMVQLQGSTESWSQFFSMPWGSLRLFLIIMRAWTAKETEIVTTQMQPKNQ